MILHVILTMITKYNCCYRLVTHITVTTSHNIKKDVEGSRRTLY